MFLAWLLAWCGGAPVVGQTGAPAWNLRSRHGDIVYFAFPTPTRIERYDLAQERWLPSIGLSDTATALRVDAAGIFVAYGRAVMVRGLDGSNERPVYNSAYNISGLLSDSQYLFVFSPSGGDVRIASIRKSDLQFVAEWNGTYSLSAGFSIAAGARRIYGINTYTTSFSTIELSYKADGSFGTTTERWSDTGSFGEKASTWVFPDEGSVLRNNGIVFGTPGVTYRASLAGALDDADFYGADVLVVLRGDTLYAYANTLLESGTYKLPSAHRAVAVRGTKVFAFVPNAAETSGISVTSVPIAQLTAAQPGAAIDPAAIKFTPDDIIDAGDGTYFLPCSAQKSIFRWSAAQHRYVDSIPLVSAPAFVAYSASLNRLYLGYGTGEIKQIKLDAGSRTETPFVNLPMAVRGLQAAGDLIFAVDDSGAWCTHYLFDAAGVQKAAKEWNYYSKEYIWSPGKRRMYFFRDDSSPNDLHYEEIGADGKIAAAGETPYHGSYRIVHPIRVSQDETGVLLGSGVVFAATGLSYAGALSNDIADAVSLNNRWVTIRPAGTGTQLQAWTTNLLLDKALSVPGAPLRVFKVADGRFLVFSTSSGYTGTSFVDLAGNGTVESSPLIVSAPAAATFYLGHVGALVVGVEGANLSFQWFKDGQAIPGATNAIYTFANVKPSDAGRYHVVISNNVGTISTQPVLVQAVTYDPGRIVNLSVLSSVRTPGDVFTVGFVAGGNATSGAKALLTRVMGPSLVNYGISAPNANPDPSFRFFANGVQVGSNDNWQGGADLLSAFQRLGASPFSHGGSKDSALLLDRLAKGNYSAIVAGVGASTGLALAEVYEDLAGLQMTPATPRLINVSTLKDVEAGGSIIAGFVIGGAAPVRVLIRAVGPSLESQGVTQRMSDPKFTLNQAGVALALTENNNWSYGLSSAFSAVGAFALQAFSTDAALVADLKPGVYSVVVSDRSGGGGNVLVEVYEANGVQGSSFSNTGSPPGTEGLTPVSPSSVEPGGTESD